MLKSLWIDGVFSKSYKQGKKHAEAVFGHHSQATAWFRINSFGGGIHGRRTNSLVGSIMRLHRQDKLISEIKRKHGTLPEFID